MEKVKGKKKKLVFISGGIVVILILLAVYFLLLAPRFRPSPSAGPSDTVYARMFQSSTQQGFYLRNATGRMEYLDFETGQQVPLCGKANCGHTEKEDCNAYLTYSDQGHEYTCSSFIAYQDHLYLFCTDSLVTVLVQADLDGANRKKLAQMEMNAPSEIYGSDGKLFFVCQWINLDPDSVGSSGSSGSVLMEFDLSSAQSRTILNGEKSDDVFVWIHGVDGSTLYYSVSSLTDNEEENQKSGFYRYQSPAGTFEKIADRDKLNEWDTFRMRKNFLYYVKEQGDGTSKVIELDLLTNKERTIAQHEGEAKLWGPYGSLLSLAFSTDNDTGELLGAWHYDLDTDQKVDPSWPEEAAKSVVINNAAPNGYIVSVISPEDASFWAYITKEDYKQGIANFIPMERE